MFYLEMRMNTKETCYTLLQIHNMFEATQPRIFSLEELHSYAYWEYDVLHVRARTCNTSYCKSASLYYDVRWTNGRVGIPPKIRARVRAYPGSFDITTKKKEKEKDF